MVFITWIYIYLHSSHACLLSVQPGQELGYIHIMLDRVAFYYKISLDIQVICPITTWLNLYNKSHCFCRQVHFLSCSNILVCEWFEIEIKWCSMGGLLLSRSRIQWNLPHIQKYERAWSESAWRILSIDRKSKYNKQLVQSIERLDRINLYVRSVRESDRCGFSSSRVGLPKFL